MIQKINKSFLLITRKHFKRHCFIIKKLSTMSKKIKYINLPIYSIATFNEFYIVSGGGGGKTGIKNEILIYKHKIENSEPVFKIETGAKIIQNMYVCPQRKILIASANQNIKIFTIINNEKSIELQEKETFRADFAQKNSTIYSLCFHTNRNLLCTAGEDMTVRFFTLDQNQRPTQKYFQHSLHTNPLKNVDHNHQNLFLSCDTHQIIVVDVETNKIVRKVFNDQLQPQKSLFQSAYFNGSGDKELLICHYILRKAAYVTKERKGKFETAEITKDQSCLTSYSKPLQLLGIACGNGTTYLVNANNLQVVSKEQNHGFVITGGTISRGGRFITGTPECSYSIQQSDQPLLPFSCLPFISIILSLFMIFLLSSPVLFSDLSQTDL